MRPHLFAPALVTVDPPSGAATLTIERDVAGARLIHDLLTGQAGGYKLLLVPDVPEVRAALQAVGEWPAELSGPPCDLCNDTGLCAHEVPNGFGEGPCTCEIGTRASARLRAAQQARRAALAEQRERGQLVGRASRADG